MGNKVIVISSITFILLFFVNNVFLRKDWEIHSDNTTDGFPVKIQECEPQNCTIYLNFFGTVNPLQRAALTSEVSDKVTAIYLVVRG